MDKGMLTAISLRSHDHLLKDYRLILNETTYLVAQRMELPGQYLRKKESRGVSKSKDGYKA